MELLSQALDFLLMSTNEAEPLFFNVEGYVNELYTSYHVRTLLSNTMGSEFRTSLLFKWSKVLR